MSKKRVVVTGAAGFIGSNLCRALLEAGHTVVALDDLSAGTLENLPAGVEFHRLDIRADVRPAIRGAHTVFHLAAKNCLADCAANPVDTYSINVAGTANLVEAVRAEKVEHLIYADTSAEYEGIFDFPSKVAAVRPLSIYACSKRGGWLASEAICRHYGIAFSTVRYFNVYGPAQDWRRVIPPVMSAFTRKLLAGERPVIYGTGDKSRDFIHVDDVNAFHLMLLERESLRGGIYNLGSGEDYSILEIFRRIEAVIQSGLAPRFEAELPGEATRTQADLTETLKTGWAPRIGLDEGIRSFVQYTREKLAEPEIRTGKAVEPSPGMSHETVTELNQ